MQVTRAIVLRTVRHTDSRLVVSLFTEHHGMITTMVRISRGGRAGGRSALWQLLNILDVNLDYRPSSDFQTLGEVSISTPWKALPYHPFKASMSIFLADFLYHSLRGEGVNTDLFGFLVNSLTWLDESDGQFSDFHLLLMIRMTRFLGILPGIAGYSKRSVYDMKSAAFTSVLPEHGQYLEPVYAAWIPLLLRMDYSQMHLLRLGRRERRHMLEVILRYYHLHVPAFGELQSLDILRELFS